MNNILKANQPQPHEQWNGNLAHRKTIQNQRERIDKLENELDFEILHKVIANEELRRVQEQLDHKSICFRAAMRELGEMDKKLEVEQNRSAAIENQLERYQELVFNLGDQIMGLKPDPDQPFKQPELPTFPDTFMSDYLSKHPDATEKNVLFEFCPEECGYPVSSRHKACVGEYFKEVCEACWNQPLEVEK